MQDYITNNRAMKMNMNMSSIRSKMINSSLDQSFSENIERARSWFDSEKFRRLKEIENARIISIGNAVPL